MPFVKCKSSQNAHYDAVACVLRVRDKPFGILVLSESAVELLEFNTQRWWPLPMIQENIGCSMTTLGSKVYVVGGMASGPPCALSSSGSSATTAATAASACHSFAFGANEWQSLPNMLEGRTYPAAIGLSELDSLFVFGGRQISNWKELNSVECYHRPSKTWTFKAPLSRARMAPAVVALSKTTVAILGGYTGDSWSTSIEIYNASTDKWNNHTSPTSTSTSTTTTTTINIPSMPVAMAFPKGLVISSQKDGTAERIMVIGTSLLRSSSNSSFTVILSYNIQTGKWTKLMGIPPFKKRILSPSEGCAAVIHDQKLYTIGGRSNNHRYQYASKEVLEWSVSPDDATLVRDLQFATPLQTIRKSSSKRNLHGNNNNGNNNINNITGNGSVSGNSLRSVPFSTIQVNEGDAESVAGTIMTAAVSIGSQLPSHRKGSMNMNALQPQIPEEEVEDLVETVMTTEESIEITDAQGMTGRYIGKVKASDGQTPHGTGQFTTMLSGDVYDGEWRHGVRQGYGRMKYAGGDVFEGWFQQDQKHGRGTYQWRDGRQYEGHFINDMADDPNGTLTWKNGTLFVGRFVKDERTGTGVIRFPDNVRYTGDFKNGKYDGYGTCTFADGRVYTGNWKKGKAHGLGKLVEADGTVLHDGKWEKDAPVMSS